MSRTKRNRKNEEFQLEKEIHSLKKIKEIYQKTGDESVFFSNHNTQSLFNNRYYNEFQKISSIDGTIDFYLRRIKRLKLDRACTHQEFIKYASNIVRKTGKRKIVNRVKRVKLEDIENEDFNYSKENKKCKKIAWMFSD